MAFFGAGLGIGQRMIGCLLAGLLGCPMALSAVQQTAKGSSPAWCPRGAGGIGGWWRDVGILQN